MSKLQDLVARTWLAKLTKEEVAQEHQLLEAEAVELFHADKATKVSVNVGDKIVNGTLVEGTRANLDAEALRERLTPEQWAKITVPQIDKDLLEAHILTGDIDSEVVEQCTELRPSKPFIRFTVKEGAAPVAPVKKARAGRKGK